MNITNLFPVPHHLPNSYTFAVVVLLYFQLFVIVKMLKTSKDAIGFSNKWFTLAFINTLIILLFFMIVPDKLIPMDKW